MSREFSLYLDLVRFLASCMVVLYHSNLRSLSVEKLPLSDYGHAAVIIFFVLSGYVIAYITETKENTPKAYFASRLSRIYSLALPAVLLTPLLDALGETLQPAFYDGATTHDLWAVRVVSSLLFANESWFVSIMSFSNVPYWSLCYEMSYYMLFAMYFFLRGRQRIWLIGFTCLLLGPKILMLAPIWCLGALLHYRRFPHLGEAAGWALFLGSVVLFCLFQSLQLTEYFSQVFRGWVGDHWHKQFTFSKFFLGDYLLAAIIFMNFVGFRRIAPRFRGLFVRIGPAVRVLSGYTFSIYIFHQPLLQFFAALIDGDPAAGYGFYLQVLTCVALAIWVLGSITEQRRHLLRAWLYDTLGRLERSRVWRERLQPLLVT